MSYEEICADNRAAFEAMEILLRLIALYTSLNLPTWKLQEDLKDIKHRIASNIKVIQ